MGKVLEKWKVFAGGAAPDLPHITAAGEWPLIAAELYEALADAEAKVTEWELEAKRLYGVGQEIEEMRVMLQAKLEGMERDRDELWCRALTSQDPRIINIVTRRFLELRAAAQEERR